MDLELPNALRVDFARICMEDHISRVGSGSGDHNGLPQHLGTLHSFKLAAAEAATDDIGRAIALMRLPRLEEHHGLEHPVHERQHLTHAVEIPVHVAIFTSVFTSLYQDVRMRLIVFS